MIRAVAVVVPAHDEEELIGGCLEAVRRATAHPALRDVRLGVFVVADSCRDATARIARAHGAEVAEESCGSAGAARALGTAQALHGFLGPGLAADEIWLAHTDADSRVPRAWLAAQLAHAGAGFHAQAGTVTVDDWTGHPPGTAARFRRHYGPARAFPGAPEAPHPHVHGANLAVRADAYTAVGGFQEVPAGEDRALVMALDAGGWRVRRTAAHPVRTSARRTPRAPGGFGDLLLAMDRQHGSEFRPAPGNWAREAGLPGAHCLSRW